MENKLQKLIGKRVIKSSSGGAAGSILYVNFEGGEYLAIYCSWRIDFNEKVIVSARDRFESPDGLIVKESPILQEHSIKDVFLSKQFDLTLTFENGLSLKVFSDINELQDDYDENWEYGNPKNNEVFVISNKFTIEKTSYE